MINPPANLTKSGVTAWNKLTESQKKYRPEEYLRSYHFTSYEYYQEFFEERRVVPFRERLLEGVSTPIDPEFLNNLSKILADLNDKLTELDNGKQDKPYDW
jgi:hypothetical protein